MPALFRNRNNLTINRYIVRMSWSIAKPLRQSTSTPYIKRFIMKILVRNLARTMTEHEIRTLFSEHGSVGACNLVLDTETGQSKGFAFVEMPNEDEAQKAIESLNQALVAKSKIRVKKADV